MSHSIRKRHTGLDELISRGLLITRPELQKWIEVSRKIWKRDLWKFALNHKDAELMRFVLDNRYMCDLSVLFHAIFEQSDDTWFKLWKEMGYEYNVGWPFYAVAAAQLKKSTFLFAWPRYQQIYPITFIAIFCAITHLTKIMVSVPLDSHVIEHVKWLADYTLDINN